MLTPLSIHHVGVVVQDLAASAAWYHDKLGFKRQYEYSFPGSRVVMPIKGRAHLELFKTDGAAPMSADRRDIQLNARVGGLNHFVLEVPNVEEAVASLRSKGVEVVAPPSNVPNDSGDRFAFIRDNEGLLVEIFEDQK